MSKRKTDSPSIALGPLFAVSSLVVLLALASLVMFFMFRPREREEIPAPSETDGASEVRNDEEAEATFAGAESCAVCHGQASTGWQSSQHARAARPIDDALDRGAFEPSQSVTHGSFTSEFRRSPDGPFELVTVGLDGSRKPYEPESVIAVEPIRQYVIPFEGGRFQVSELAFDTDRKDWFDVFGEEDRQPHEWGFWANRGMNWNSQCAYCHMTNLAKGYDERADTYRTTWSEWGVSCEQCHGAMGAHVQSPEPLASPLSGMTPAQTVALCGSCHARRTELTGAFAPGDSFFDHFRPDLPEHPAAYYADGQVRDEDFEYGSFLMSLMFHKGITCLDCHDPHSGNLLQPIEDNALCLTCHSLANPKRDALPIDPVNHGRHRPGSTGNLCVECHMPATLYMVRDARRDHGFTTPDPKLTLDHGIPNACNRCHEDKSAEWADEWTAKWYGDNMDRRSRKRAVAVADGHEGNEAAVPALLRLAKEEDIPAWRSVLLALAGQWAHREDVRAALVEALRDGHPLVRSAAVRSLEPLPEGAALVSPLLTDPVRLVRLDAAWVLRYGLDPGHPAALELSNSLAVQSDQPVGAWRRGEWARAQRRLVEAERWLERAAQWDPETAWFHHSLGIVYHERGKPSLAVVELERAMELEPDDAEHPYAMALLLGELGDVGQAAAMFEQTVEINPDFARAWYNLGLARAQLDQSGRGIDAIRRAEALAPGVADFPYARATLHFRQGELGLAIIAAQRALDIDGDHGPAEALLQQLSR